MKCIGCGGDINEDPVLERCAISGCTAQGTYHARCVPLNNAAPRCALHAATTRTETAPKPPCSFQGCLGKSIKTCSKCEEPFCWRHAADSKTAPHSCSGRRKRGLEGAQEDANAQSEAKVTKPVKVACKTMSAFLSRKPARIIYRSGQTVVIQCHVHPDEEQKLSYEWYVNGQKDANQKSTFSFSVQPANTPAERRLAFEIYAHAVKSDGSYAESDKITLRFAQAAVTGTPNVGKTTEDIQTGFLPLILEKEELFRAPTATPASDRAVAVQSGDPRLVYVGDQTFDMAAIFKTGSKVDQIQVASNAFRWDREAFTAMFRHELLHCDQARKITEPGYWSDLCAKNLGLGTEQVRQFMESEAYLSYLENTSVSFQFLREGGAIRSFILNLENARKALEDLKEAGSKYVVEAATFVNELEGRAQKAFPELLHWGAFEDAAKIDPDIKPVI